MERSNWVDFKAVKAAVSMEMVLTRYGVTDTLKRVGDELRGRCPIHKGEGKDAFHVNISKQCFQCFSCQAHGNCLDFCAAMEQCSVRDAALKLQGWFLDQPPAAETSARKESQTKLSTATALASVPAVNEPLKFQLQGIDPNHPYLKQRGIWKETAEKFGAGFFSGRGSMSGRVVIPIHNQFGDLVAYTGRAIDGSEPRYKLPAGFQKSVELFNLHRVKPGERGGEIFVVEGFFGVMKLHQAGFPAVALMGSKISDAQVRLLACNFTHAVLLLDEDEAGLEGAMDAVLGLSHFMYVTTGCLTKDIDELSEDEIKRQLAVEVAIERKRPVLVK